MESINLFVNPIPPVTKLAIETRVFPQTLSTTLKNQQPSIQSNGREKEREKNTFYPHSGCGSRENDLINDDRPACISGKIIFN